jgi:hypothetical protein
MFRDDPAGLVPAKLSRCEMSQFNTTPKATAFEEVEAGGSISFPASAVSLLMVGFTIITVHGNGTPKRYKLVWLRELQVHEWLPEVKPVDDLCSLYNIQ